MSLWKQTMIFLLSFAFIIMLSIVTHSINNKFLLLEVTKITVIAKNLEIEDLENQVSDLYYKLTTTDGYVLPDSGSLIFPFYPNSEIRITSQFHLRENPFRLNVGPTNIEDRLHHGIDIVSEKQSIIRTTVSGKIIAHWPVPNGYWKGDGDNGSKIIILDKNGFEHIFMHFNATYVSSEEGKNYVEAGDVIGRMGSSGKTTGPHLHYEIRKGNKETGYTWYDPLDYFDIKVIEDGYVLFPEDSIDILTIGK